jgi:DNA end-binding protein Ku
MGTFSLSERSRMIRLGTAPRGDESHMARAIWTGSISFGLVNIPVGLYSAVSEKTIRFHQLQKGTSERVRYKRVNESTGDEVPYDDIVKGYEVGDGRYVLLTPAELESVEPAGGRTIEIEDFVDQADIDPIFYASTYYVGPKNDVASRPYALLVEAMGKAQKIAIARFVMRSKEHLAAIRVNGDVLALETMYFADEIRDPRREVEITPAADPPRERELQTAISLIESMSAKWDPTSYRDRYRERIEELIEQKLSGEETVARRVPERATNVVDLMDALKASVEAVRTNRRAGSPETQQVSAERPKRAGSKKAADGARPHEQLAMMSREELYQLAQDIRVPGRSKMNRDELAQAVADAQAARRAS